MPEGCRSYGVERFSACGCDGHVFFGGVHCDRGGCLMLPGDFDASADVRKLVTYAIVNGVRRDIESVSFDNELSGDLPEQVVSGGLAGGDGTVVWAAQPDVAHREVSPWHKVAGWPPSAGDRFQVYVKIGRAHVRTPVTRPPRMPPPAR